MILLDRPFSDSYTHRFSLDFEMKARLKSRLSRKSWEGIYDPNFNRSVDLGLFEQIVGGASPLENRLDSYDPHAT